MPKSLADELSRFERAAIEHGEATENGDGKRANRNYYKLANAVKAIRGYGASGSDALVTLLDHSNPHVKCWAASYLLSVAPERAVAVLRELSQGSGIAAFDAKMTLREWRRDPSRFLQD